MKRSKCFAAVLQRLILPSFQLWSLLFIVSAGVVVVEGSNIEDDQKPNLIDSPNPYLKGCLQAKVPGWESRWRVCNSYDPPELRGTICDEPPFENYLEIRVASGNWASATALAWLAQIILSEFLGVPSSDESGSFGATRNFYDYDGRMDYQSSNPGSAVNEPSQGDIYEKHGGDCRAMDNTPDNYKPCAHFFPELWGGYRQTSTDYVQQGLIEPVQGLGVLAQESWFIPKFTAFREPSIVSYFGLSGEENRRKLAELFKRPTTWKDYCDLVSTNNCSVPDKTAQRYPKEEEYIMMFAEGLYTGHFRYTDANNCTTWPQNCTGHAADYPCGWNSLMETNIYHNDMGLEMKNGPDGSPKGYTSGQLVEMWHAANATKENLLMMWWTPEPLYQMYLGTDAEMVPVMLPAFTEECYELQERLIDESCEANLTMRVGPPEAACTNPPESLSKLITGKLYELLNDPKIPDAAVSPAHDMLSRFRITEVQLGQLFNLWDSEPTPRDAVCQWVVDNFDYFYSMVPFSYPRVVKQEASTAFAYGMLGLSIAAVCVVTGTFCLVYYLRFKPAIRYAQLDFLYMLLSGSILVVIGALIITIPASDGTCISSNWFVNVGYTLELTPLIIKVAAINHMSAAAQTMRRTKLNRKTLYELVAGITFLMVLYLSIWTGVDPPQQAAEYEMTDSTTEAGAYIVVLRTYCNGGDSDVWQYAAVVWNAVLLLCASVLAFQTRSVIQEFNEARILAFLIYSHSLFVILRMCLVAFSGSISGYTQDLLQSLLISVDQIAGCFIYFLPKFLASGVNSTESSSLYVPRLSRLALPPVSSTGENSSGNSHRGSNRFVESSLDKIEEESAGSHSIKLEQPMNSTTSNNTREPCTASNNDSTAGASSSASSYNPENIDKKLPVVSGMESSCVHEECVIVA